MAFQHKNIRLKQFKRQIRNLKKNFIKEILNLMIFQKYSFSIVGGTIGHELPFLGITVIKKKFNLIVHIVFQKKPVKSDKFRKCENKLT